MLDPKDAGRPPAQGLLEDPDVELGISVGLAAMPAFPEEEASLEQDIGARRKKEKEDVAQTRTALGACCCASCYQCPLLCLRMARCCLVQGSFGTWHLLRGRLFLRRSCRPQ